MARLRSGEHSIPPFHWEIEFPEVFSRANRGFDAFVGNPPFAGKNTLLAGNREGYVDWLKTIHVESHGNSDLVAHFFRRTFDLLCEEGCLGLIATNTVGQGDTRTTGLRWICLNGGTIYSARRRMKWPGVAAVIVSVVNVARGHVAPPYVLDGKNVDRITAYLFHAGGHESPPTLKANAAKSFQGVIPLGMGFTFDDDADDATPLSVMHDLIAEDATNQERIFPFIGWDEVANDPQHAPDRYIINFDEMSEDEARRWPKLMEIVERKVKPARLKQKDKGGKQYWWRFLRPRGELHQAIRGLDRVMVTASQAMTRYAIAMLPNRTVFSSNLTVIADDRVETWGVMQSQAHEAWARAFCATLKDDLAYAPTDGFDNFPFPPANPSLERAAEGCLKGRSQIMIAADEGLTPTYNRFHDPHEKSPDILKLRELHAAMDRAVLEAYGWDDLAQTARCEFLLDYEEEDDDDSDTSTTRKRVSSGRGKKKPWRLRWPDDFRDEVLARLLELNEQRHQEELLAGKTAAAAEKPKTSGRKRGAKKPKAKPESPELF